ncbi:hypothetical protein SAMN05444395_10530 [Flavobacterium fryxellicola]|nr:hypothetical protein SAMN05444395_10530 [Flavobacterium fryxellicola]
MTNEIFSFILFYFAFGFFVKSILGSVVNLYDYIFRLFIFVMIPLQTVACTFLVEILV